MDSLESVLKYIRAGDSPRALREFPALIEDPRWQAEALGHRAWLYRSLGQFEKALADYEALLLLRPQSGEVQSLLAETRLLAGDAQGALLGAIEALRNDPLSQGAARVVQRAQAALGAAQDEPPQLKPKPNPAGGIAFETLPSNKIIAALESDPRSFTGSTHPDTARLIYALVRNCRPRLVVETGSYIGYSTLWIAQALAENQFGHLHSFDLFKDYVGYVSPILGPREDFAEIAREHLLRAGLIEQVSFHRGDSAQRISADLSAQGTTIDFAFIDGDHRMRGCLRDWFAVDALLAQGGLVLLHDTEPDRVHWLGPRYLIEELGIREAEHYSVANLPTPDGLGLALIQKKQPAVGKRWHPPLGKIVADWFLSSAFLRNQKK